MQDEVSHQKSAANTPFFFLGEKMIIDFNWLVMLMERFQSMDRTNDNFDEPCWIAPPLGAVKLKH